MKKLELIKIIDKAIIAEIPIAVVIENKNIIDKHDKEGNLVGKTVDLNFEFIINNYSNLHAKRKYYYDSYDEECRLNKANNISIVAIYSGNESILLHLNDYLISN